MGLRGEQFFVRLAFFVAFFILNKKIHMFVLQPKLDELMAFKTNEA